MSYTEPLLTQPIAAAIGRALPVIPALRHQAAGPPRTMAITLPASSVAAVC